MMVKYHRKKFVAKKGMRLPEENGRGTDTGGAGIDEGGATGGVNKNKRAS